MALKDTIAAARKEVQDAGGIRPVPNASNKETRDTEKSSTARGSAARAKPARSAAASVRVVSAADAKAGRSGKRPSEMTRAERKAERESKRSEEDLHYSAANIILERQEEYHSRRRLWWILIGVGVALTIASFLLTRAFPVNDAANAPYVTVSIVTLVLAYVLIIGAFIFDWRKIKPLRTAASEEASRLSNKRLKSLIREDAEAKAAAKASKKSR